LDTPKKLSSTKLEILVRGNELLVRVNELVVFDGGDLRRTVVFGGDGVGVVERRRILKYSDKI
jgi:hypothetical protein